MTSDGESSQQLTLSRPDLKIEVREGESLKQAVLRVIRAEILSGVLEPGSKLSESRLATRFGVSRMPVREALIELERADLVTIERKRGTFVKRISQREAMDMFDIREALEATAARLCAQRANTALIEEMEKLAKEMEVAVENGDQIGYIELDGRFHAMIFDGSDNRRLHDHYRLLITHLHREILGSIAVRKTGRMARSYSEHQEIISALRVRDSELAERVMKQHVQNGKRELVEAMEAAESHEKPLKAGTARA